MKKAFLPFRRLPVRLPQIRSLRIGRALLAAAPLLAGSALADTVTIRADYWYPMNGTPGNALPGFMIEIAQYGLTKGGHKVDYALVPWERALHMVRKGEIDCVVGAYKSDAPDLVFPENSQAVDTVAAYVKKGSAWRYTTLDDLKKIKLGAISGYGYGDDITAYIEKNPQQVQLTVGDNALEQNIKKLAAGRIDALIESPSVFNAKLKDLHMEDQFEQAGTLSDIVDVYVACSPAKESTKTYAKLISDGTEELRQSGELAKILAKYGLKDWK